MKRRVTPAAASAATNGTAAAAAAAALARAVVQAPPPQAVRSVLTGFSLQVLPRFAFDVRNDLDCNNIEFLSEDVLLYPVGQNFAVYNYKTATAFKGEHNQKTHFLSLRWFYGN